MSGDGWFDMALCHDVFQIGSAQVIRGATQLGGEIVINGGADERVGLVRWCFAGRIQIIPGAL